MILLQTVLTLTFNLMIHDFQECWLNIDRQQVDLYMVGIKKVPTTLIYLYLKEG